MMRKFSIRIAILTGCACLLSVIVYWPYWETLLNERETRNFRDRLAAEIEGADQIDLVEYSGMYDFLAADGAPDQTHPTVEYARIILDFKQKMELAAIVRGIDATPKNTFSLAIRDPHHSFEFRRNGVLTQWFSVCFSSHRLKWYITPGDPWVEEQALEPEGLVDALRPYIENLGLRVGVDWQKIAKP